MEAFDPVDPWRLALALAECAIGVSDPNPRVGCAIVSADGKRVLGQGHTQRAGGPHAEVMALRDAWERGETVRGATAYVTLEPCAHHGRTPPCCDALVRSGLRRVVVAAGDPDPRVNGRGIARLRAAGVEVRQSRRDVCIAANDLNIGFISQMTRGRPWVRLMAGLTTHGLQEVSMCTDPEALADRRAWRRRAGAVLTTAGCHGDLEGALADAHDAKVIRCAADHTGHTEPQQIVADLAAQGINELYVEADWPFSRAMVDAGVVDELVVYQDLEADNGSFDWRGAGLRCMSAKRLGRCVCVIARLNMTTQ